MKKLVWRMERHEPHVVSARYLAVLLLASCGDDGLTARDYTVVSNQEAVWENAESWSLTDMWHIGAVDAPADEILVGPVVVAIGPEGLIHVGDQGMGSVREFDANGNFIKHVAEGGAGPGEIRGLVTLGWSSTDQLWAVSGGKYSIFDRTGALVRESPRQRSARPRIIERSWFDREGNLIDVSATTRSDGSSGVEFYRVNAAGERVGNSIEVQYPLATFTEPAGPEGVAPAAVPAERLEDFRPKLVYTVVYDDYLWFAETDRYRLVKMSFNGDTLMAVTASHRNSELSSEERRELSDMLQRRGWELEDTRYGRQILQNIYTLTDGTLLVQVETVTGKSGNEIDVFSGEGHFQGTLALSKPLDRDSPWAIRGDTIIAAIRDSLDVLGLVRMHLTRPK